MFCRFQIICTNMHIGNLCNCAKVIASRRIDFVPATALLSGAASSSTICVLFLRDNRTAVISNLVGGSEFSRSSTIWCKDFHLEQVRCVNRNVGALHEFCWYGYAWIACPGRWEIKRLCMRNPCLQDILGNLLGVIEQAQSGNSDRSTDRVKDLLADLEAKVHGRTL